MVKGTYWGNRLEGKFVGFKSQRITQLNVIAFLLCASARDAVVNRTHGSSA